MNDISRQIEKEYHVESIGFTPAPRGFCAETYVMKTINNNYFIKIFHNRRFANSAVSSMQGLVYLSESLSFIPAPIKTAKNSYYIELNDGRIACLYEYIDGTQHQVNDDPLELIPYMAQLYNMKKVQFIKSETFEICHWQTLNDLDNYKLLVSSAVKECIYKEIEIIHKAWLYYNSLSAKLKNEHLKFFITHGDIFNNMLKKDNKIFIIDWDDILYAPVERDLWAYILEVDQRNSVSKAFQENNLDIKFSESNIHYYLLKRFFDDIYDYIEIDINNCMLAKKTANDIQDVFDWLLPAMKDIVL